MKNNQLSIFFILFSFLFNNNAMEMSLSNEQLKKTTNLELKATLYSNACQNYLNGINDIADQYNGIKQIEQKEKYIEDAGPLFLNLFYKRIGVYKDLNEIFFKLCPCNFKAHNTVCKNTTDCKEVKKYSEAFKFFYKSFNQNCFETEKNNEDNRFYYIYESFYKQFITLTKQYLEFKNQSKDKFLCLKWLSHNNKKPYNKITSQIKAYNNLQEKNNTKIYAENNFLPIMHYSSRIVNKDFSLVDIALHEMLHFLSWYNSSLSTKDSLQLFSIPDRINFCGIVMHNELKFNYFMQEVANYQNIVANIIALLNAPLTEYLLREDKINSYFYPLLATNNKSDMQQLFSNFFFIAMKNKNKDLKLNDSDFCRAFELMWTVLKKSPYAQQVNNTIDTIFQDSMHKDENIKKFIHDSVCFIKIFHGLKDILLPTLVQTSKDHENFIRLLTLECIKNGSVYSAQDFKKFIATNDYAHQENQQYEKKIRSLEYDLYKFFGINYNELTVKNISRLNEKELKSVACFYHQVYPEETKNIISEYSFSDKVLNNTPENQEYQNKLKSMYILFKDTIVNNNIPEGFLLEGDVTFKKDLLLFFISNIFKPDTEIAFENINKIKDQYNKN